MFDLMKNLFTDQGREKSRDVAKERLRLVLIHDRIGVSPEIIEDLRGDLIEVISKYMDIDEEELEMELNHQDNSVALVANIPVKELKNR